MYDLFAARSWGQSIAAQSAALSSGLLCISEHGSYTPFGPCMEGPPLLNHQKPLEEFG